MNIRYVGNNDSTDYDSNNDTLIKLKAKISQVFDKFHNSRSMRPYKA